MTQKTIIKQKLNSILNKVKLLKRQMVQITTLQKQFTFEKLISSTKSALHRQNNKNKNSQDKQNNINSINTNTNTAHRQQNKITKIQNIKSSRQNFDNQKCLALSQSSNDLKILKDGLISQLSQIKSIQRRSEAMRRTNQKIKQYNSNQKRNYRYSIERSQKIDSRLMKDVESSKVSFQVVSSQNASVTITNSNISVVKKTLSQTQTKVLKCQKGHQYYQGTVNDHDQPHGNGRLQPCCKSIPQQIGCKNISDYIFYQGQFVNAKFHGFGTLSYKGGVKYVGQFRDGKRHGKGSMYFNGKAEVANWQNDVFISIM